VLSSGWFTSVWILNSNISEHPVYPIFVPTRLWRWNTQSVPNRWHFNYRCQWITQKKAYNIQNKAKFWNKKSFSVFSPHYLVNSMSRGWGRELLKSSLVWDVGVR
jgi:hypothetical protein